MVCVFLSVRLDIVCAFCDISIGCAWRGELRLRGSFKLVVKAKFGLTKEIQNEAIVYRTLWGKRYSVLVFLCASSDLIWYIEEYKQKYEHDKTVCVPGIPAYFMDAKFAAEMKHGKTCHMLLVSYVSDQVLASNDQVWEFGLPFVLNLLYIS